VINPTVEIPRDLIEALYRRCYNPVIAYRDPHGSALWEQVGAIIGPVCLCGVGDDADPSEDLAHQPWCAKATG
jgi:hypothetical protein